MGEFGRQQVDKQYTWARVAQQMYAIYQELAVESQAIASPRVNIAGAAIP
jgi:hypothetical protein